MKFRVASPLAPGRCMASKSESRRLSLRFPARAKLARAQLARAGPRWTRTCRRSASG